ncbi:protease modulator HflC [Christensenellaceae bacterium OttesenSCG-928-M15]|nr:protease modulator HflC [Christensenellaceae bacterium OttesenSCG-928-M15]
MENNTGYQSSNTNSSGGGGNDAQASATLKRGIKRRVIFVVAILLIVFLYMQCVVITKPNEYKVIQQFGEIKYITTEPGVSLKLPFVQNEFSLPKDVRFYDIPISDVITQDKKTMVADSFVLWRVNDPTKFIRTLSGSISSAEVRIGNIAYNSMKTVISRLPQSEIISGRDELAQKIYENIGDTLDQYGVKLVGFETKHLDLPDDNKQAVYTRMISERNNIAASYEAEGEEEARMIRTETDKTVSIRLSQAAALAAETIAEGEQQYMEILAGAYNDPDKAAFYDFVRALDAAKAGLQNETTLILSPDSPLASVFNGVKE